ncbi:MAG: hypothetical protein QMC81_00285 [Thermoanaerobacterales bacterium]|nr:hypothetical protein [Bacillota bacterium]MDI6905908.1 hypothetical protein [Thermoanaerobacterales bacterium]
MIFKTLIMVAVLAIAIRTASFGLWAWRRGYRRGAVGTWLIAWLDLVAPFLVWWHYARLT